MIALGSVAFSPQLGIKSHWFQFWLGKQLDYNVQLTVQPTEDLVFSEYSGTPKHAFLLIVVTRAMITTRKKKTITTSKIY